MSRTRGARRVGRVLGLMQAGRRKRGCRMRERRKMRCSRRWAAAIYIQPGHGSEVEVAVRPGWGCPSKTTTGPATLARRWSLRLPTFRAPLCYLLSSISQLFFLSFFPTTAAPPKKVLAQRQ